MGHCVESYGDRTLKHKLEVYEPLPEDIAVFWLRCPVGSHSCCHSSLVVTEVIVRKQSRVAGFRQPTVELSVNERQTTPGTFAL